MLESVNNLVQVISAIAVIAFMLAVAVAVVVICLILTVPVMIYQAVANPYSSR